MRCHETHPPGRTAVDPPALFALLTALLICALPNVLGDGDTYTHIAAGSWMIDHRTVLRWDPFSSTFSGQPWIAHEWLSEVLLAEAYRLGGLTGVVLLAAAAAAAAFGNLARHVGRRNGWLGTMLLTTAALLCVLPSMTARPHLLSLPLLEMWVAGLLVARQERRAPSWWLLPLMAVWANLHGSFAFGIMLAVPFALEASWAGRRSNVWLWWRFLAGAVGAGLMTPQGWDGLLFPFRLLQLHSLGLIHEWQPTNFSSNPGLEVSLLAVVALLATGRVRMTGLQLIVLLGLLHLALMHSRYAMLFGMAGALILAEPAGRVLADFKAGSRAALPRPGARALCWFGVALTVMLRVSHPVEATDGYARPVSALAQLPSAIAGLPVLNSYQFGGYLALRGMRPFVDGRLELFGDEFIADYLALAAPVDARLARTVDRYGIDWAVLAVEDPLVARFDGMAGWRREYADGVAVVFVRG